MDKNSVQPLGLDFNPNSHPLSTEKPVGISTESSYPQNPQYSIGLHVLYTHHVSVT